jgi:hypothetical protein
MKLKGLFSVIIFFISTFCYADYVKCYNGDDMIYQHYVHGESYDGNIYIFVENDSKAVVFYNGKCILKIVEKDIKNAIQVKKASSPNVSYGETR